MHAATERSTSWAVGCDARLAAQLDAVACSVAMRYVAIASVDFDHGVWITAVTPQLWREGAPITTLGDLRDLYLAKRSHD